MSSIKNLSIAFMVLAFASCKKDDPAPPAPTVVKDWSIPLSAKNENPGLASRNETGTATLQLLSDNSLKYTINVTGLAAGDALVAAHLHIGDVITNGPVVLGLNPTFTGASASGTIANVRTSLVDSLKNDVNEIYFNVHSTQVASGLVRGQLNTKLELSLDVLMNGTNEVPAVITTATGLAQLRLTIGRKLYTKITVSTLEAGDALAAAHIHRGATGVNGPVMLGLYTSAADFGTVKIFTVDEVMFASLKNDALYFNAHSIIRPGGIVRGQIR
ncbi:MAG: CHRD domain-containing protein [Ferruginibacter sp.]|nr:CHRD domain-containing protein [Ferruginibacter sp.]